MARAALLLLLLVQQADIDSTVAKGLKVDEEARKKIEAKGKDQKDVLALLLDPKVWAEGVKRIDAKLGLWTGTFEIDVKFGSFSKNMPAWGDGKNGKGKVEIDADVLAEYHKKAKDYAKQVKSGAQVVVPPARMDGIIWHELAHCFVTGKVPDWYGEGICTYIAGDPHFVAFFRQQKQEVKEIDAEIDFKYTYGRGWAFFEWMEAKHGAEKVKKFVALVATGKTPAEAASEATGLTWEKVKSDECAWSKKWIAELSIK